MECRISQNVKPYIDLLQYDTPILPTYRWPSIRFFVNCDLSSKQMTTAEEKRPNQTSEAHSAICCAHCPPIGKDSLDQSEAADAAQVLKALADPTRLQILSIIAAAPGGEACACHLPEIVGRSQPTVSHHLRTLAKAGVIEREQRGKWAWFKAEPKTLATVAKFLSPTTK